MSSPVTTHTLNLGFSSHRRADSRSLPGRTTFTQKTLSHADPCALFRSPLCRSQLLSYRHAHLSTPTRRVSVSLHAAAPITTTFPDARLLPSKPLSPRLLRTLLPAATPVATTLLSTRSPVNTHAPTHGFSSYRRADSHYLPGHTTFTRKIRLHADARRYAGCNSPFRRFPVASKKNETFFENLRTFFPF